MRRCLSTVDACVATPDAVNASAYRDLVSFSYGASDVDWAVVPSGLEVSRVTNVYLDVGSLSVEI